MTVEDYYQLYKKYGGRIKLASPEELHYAATHLDANDPDMAGIVIVSEKIDVPALDPWHVRCQAYEKYWKDLARQWRENANDRVALEEIQLIQDEIRAISAGYSGIKREALLLAGDVIRLAWYIVNENDDNGKLPFIQEDLEFFCEASGGREKQTPLGKDCGVFFCHLCKSKL